MTDVIRTCRRTWRRLGVPARVVEEMTDELQGDLAAAARDGVSGQAFVGGDAAGFARAWASARGLVRPRWRVLSTTAAAALGVIPAVFIALFVPVASTSPWFIQILQPGNRTLYCETETGCQTPELQGFGQMEFLLYVLAVLAAWCGALLAASAWLRRAADPARVLTVRVIAVVLPVAALVAAPVTYIWLESQPECCRSAQSTWGWPLLFALIVGGSVAAARAAVVSVQRRRRVDDQVVLNR